MIKLWVYPMFGYFIWALQWHLLAGRYWWTLFAVVLMWIYAAWAAKLSAKEPKVKASRHPDDYTVWQMWKSGRSDRMLIRAMRMLPEGSADREILARFLLPYLQQSLARVGKEVKG